MIDLKRQNEIFEKESPGEILKWGWDQFNDKIGLLSSFGPESAVLLHLVSQVAPGLPILFIETGYHFPETLEYKQALTDKFGLNVREVRSQMTRPDFLAKHGDKLYEKNPDLCCEINKVGPLRDVLVGLSAWVSGIRRSQGPTRQGISIIELYDGGLYKLNPLANWNSRDMWHYNKEHALPVHPLFEKGYNSIGCWPCTRPVLEGEDERAGRWAGRVKTECGIHTFMKPLDKKDEAAPSS